jgi:anaerobic magnesium-protoporphyrin IX monomethyl ester cyclase
MWHAEYDENKRSPYAALQTSLGCRFGCNFCMINIINRDDNNEIGVASDYSQMRWWSTDFIIKEFDKLINMGVRTIRIVDEMFMLNPKYYIPLCEKLAKRNTDDSLRMWAYSRVDTIKRLETLKLVRKAGIKWLCLGIESSSREVRLEVSKGKFEDVDIKEVVKNVHDADIDIMANYIFGLPGDDMKKMKETLDLSLS